MVQESLAHTCVQFQCFLRQMFGKLSNNWHCLSGHLLSNSSSWPRKPDTVVHGSQTQTCNFNASDIKCPEYCHTRWFTLSQKAKLPNVNVSDTDMHFLLWTQCYTRLVIQTRLRVSLEASKITFWYIVLPSSVPNVSYMYIARNPKSSPLSVDVEGLI